LSDLARVAAINAVNNHNANPPATPPLAMVSTARARS
jgi:hypothetical protein